MGEVGPVVGTQVAAQTAPAQTSRKNTECPRAGARFTVHSPLKTQGMQETAKNSLSFLHSGSHIKI